MRCSEPGLALWVQSNARVGRSLSLGRSKIGVYETRPSLYSIIRGATCVYAYGHFLSHGGVCRSIWRRDR